MNTPTVRGDGEMHNLCDICAKEFATCKSNPIFKSDTDDAVVGCDAFEARNITGWKCFFCGYSGNAQYDTFCHECRRHK